jgi:hypothetical protein
LARIKGLKGIVDDEQTFNGTKTNSSSSFVELKHLNKQPDQHQPIKKPTKASIPAMFVKPIFKSPTQPKQSHSPVHSPFTSSPSISPFKRRPARSILTSPASPSPSRSPASTPSKSPSRTPSKSPVRSVSRSKLPPRKSPAVPPSDNESDSDGEAEVEFTKYESPVEEEETKSRSPIRKRVPKESKTKDRIKVFSGTEVSNAEFTKKVRAAQKVNKQKIYMNFQFQTYDFNFVCMFLRLFRRLKLHNLIN